MLHYIKEFPQKLHHPKEESYLFSKLRERTTELDEVLDELTRQHAEGDRCVQELEESLVRYQKDPARGFDAFAAAAERFNSSQLEHMRYETKLILPAARKHLTDEDWEEIGRAFSTNGDPRFSIDNDEAFKTLFVRILNLAPKEVVASAART
jgi:hemerythrin-like domain-containing protein